MRNITVELVLGADVYLGPGGVALVTDTGLAKVKGAFDRLDGRGPGATIDAAAIYARRAATTTPDAPREQADEGETTRQQASALPDPSAIYAARARVQGGGEGRG